MTRPTAQSDTRTNSGPKRRPPLSVWELGSLLTPVHQHRSRKQCRPKERPHFPAILSYVYRNRFVVASQVQRRFSNLLRSGRTARRHLAELESLGYLDVVATRGVSPLWPKVYYLTKRGASRLRKALAEKGKPGRVIRVDRQRGEGYSSEHVLHELWITEFMLAVWEAVQARPDLELLKVERRSLPSNPRLVVGTMRPETRLEPDAMFLHRQGSRGMITSFVEIDTGSMSVPQMEAKYARYDAWAASTGRRYLIDLYRSYGAADPRPVFRLLVIAGSRSNQCPTKRRDELLAAAEHRPAVGRSGWFTSIDELQQPESPARQLCEPVWRRCGINARLCAIFPQNIA